MATKFADKDREKEIMQKLMSEYALAHINGGKVDKRHIEFDMPYYARQGLCQDITVKITKLKITKRIGGKKMKYNKIKNAVKGLLICAFSAIGSTLTPGDSVLESECNTEIGCIFPAGHLADTARYSAYKKDKTAEMPYGIKSELAYQAIEARQRSAPIYYPN